MTNQPIQRDLSETTAPAAAVVPDKPALEGLEGKWAEQMERSMAPDESSIPPELEGFSL